MKVNGFSFSAVKAGVRYPDRLDIGLIYCDHPCVTAGVLTTSQVQAAPVVIDAERLKGGKTQAILVNSGCANACTGEEGLKIAQATSRLMSKALNISDDLVLLSSTGVIGEQLDLQPFQINCDALADGLAPDKFEQVARAIMTTDTVMKTARTTLRIGGRDVNIVGMAKGAGMIMPNMATMLSFVLTDADIRVDALQELLAEGVERTFNRITVDGDTSTNDMVLVMASGAAENLTIKKSSPSDFQAFKDGLAVVLKDLALQIVRDGEGATKTITVKVSGAKNNEDAEKIARTIANSSLVKTAFFGEDANWGRILAAMGRSGVLFSPDLVDVYFDDVCIAKNGLAVGASAEEAATRILKEKEFTLSVDLKDGTYSQEMYTCDFSLDYVRINADYRS